VPDVKDVMACEPKKLKKMRKKTVTKKGGERLWLLCWMIGENCRIIVGL